MQMNRIRRIIPKKIREKISQILVNYFDGYSTKSYSQEGEDMILRRIFNDKIGGFYVDIGAHHPKRFSNTYYFYRKGWRGINIDAMPGSMKLFKKCRKKDTNIEAAISDTEEKLIYYAFEDPALNGFSKELSQEYEKNYKLIFKKEIKTKKLSDIFDKFLPTGQKIDFLSIDVESLELNVLRSNNWDKYIPEFILVEMLDNGIKLIFENEIYKLLKSKGFCFFAKTVNTVIFKKK